VFELASGQDVLARLARPGWIRIFFGRGQLIELADGRRWRLRAIGIAGGICPMIVDSEKRKVAIAVPRRAGYGLNGRDWAYVLVPGQPRRLVRSNQWIIREDEDDIGTVTRTPWQITTTRTVPLAAVVMALTLAIHEIPGESGLGTPNTRWGAP
jgi:hypothetical protein